MRTAKVLRTSVFAFICGTSLLAASAPSSAGPMTGMAYGENQGAFVATLSHGPLDLNRTHSLSAPLLLNFWALVIVITEANGRGLVADTIDIGVAAQHLVAVPGHGNGEVAPNPNILSLGLFSGIGPYTPGSNSLSGTDTENHPLIASHFDSLNVALTFQVADDGLQINGYTLRVEGRHCNSCPILPEPTDTLREISEPSMHVLLGICALGLLVFTTLKPATRFARFHPA